MKAELRELQKQLTQDVDHARKEAKELRKSRGQITKEFADSEQARDQSSQDAVKQAEGRFVAQITAHDERLAKMEETFREKLRIEGPAEHWEQLLKDHTTKGKRWVWRTLVFGSLMVPFFYLLLVETDFLFLDSGTTSLTSIRGALILATIISAAFFVLGMLVKFTVSSFHLAHDANERLHLSHVYLSMIHEQAIEDQDRAIVLQSLFSRAETGLLKGDAKPAMPSDALTKLFGK